MTTFKPDEERKVLEMLAQGSEFAFTTIFDRYRGPIYNVAVKFLKSQTLAEEVVQEVFLKVWLKRGDLVQLRNFESYLFTMARNLIFDGIKSIAKETSGRDELTRHFQNTERADSQLIERQYEELLHDAIDQLPPQQKHIFRLAKIEGLSHQVIAERLQISRLTVKTHMAKALSTIRQNLQHHIITVALIALIIGTFANS